MQVGIIGAGPAGSSAALAALRAGARVRIWEKSRLPRHKVCGEFLSPEVLPLLQQLGAAEDFLALDPPRIRRFELNFGSRRFSATLPEPAFGLSRYAFDAWLLQRAVAQGAELLQQPAVEPWPKPSVLAWGRHFPSRQETAGSRQFGFKAHFTGPARDAVELFFFPGGYLGINAVEQGRINICGVAAEAALRTWNFDVDAFLRHHAPVADRLACLSRAMDWIRVAPLYYRNVFETPCEPGIYPAGDVLSFVDPFTGSGMLSALLSGTLAGRAAARGDDSEAHVKECRRRLRKAFRTSSWLRSVAHTSWAPPLLEWLPLVWLYRFTRPRCA